MAAAKNTRRFYQNNHVCTELDGSVTRSIFRHQNSPLALCTSGVEESRSIMAVDNSNTVMSELRDSGKAQFAYTPYGHRTVQGESNNPLAFNGEILDTPTDCYLLGSYRLASPRSYRFYSDDDQSPFGKGGLNSKAYCAGDPVNNVDPTGHFPLPNLLNIATLITASVSVGTGLAGVFAKDLKSKNALNTMSLVFGAVSAGLMVGASLKYDSKQFRLQKKNRDLKTKVGTLEKTVSKQQGTIVRQQRIIDELNAASSNPGLHARTSPMPSQYPSSVNANVYFKHRTGKVVQPSSTHQALPPQDALTSGSQMVGVRPPNSPQQGSSSSASSNSLTMMELRQLT